ncbi:hypothetical protein GQX74_009383 [Glossina fuscipes]|nr:hypothetical protein GQX74_009383 [Glossina fuscipes]
MHKLKTNKILATKKNEITSTKDSEQASNYAEKEYSQDMPQIKPWQKVSGPPILPPHLLLVILNKDTLLSHVVNGSFQTANGKKISISEESKISIQNILRECQDDLQETDYDTELKDIKARISNKSMESKFRTTATRKKRMALNNESNQTGHSTKLGERSNDKFGIIKYNSYLLEEKSDDELALQHYILWLAKEGMLQTLCRRINMLGAFDWATKMLGQNADSDNTLQEYHDIESIFNGRLPGCDTSCLPIIVSEPMHVHHQVDALSDVHRISSDAPKVALLAQKLCSSK